MAKDIIPLVVNDFGNYNLNDDDDIIIMYHNVSPIQTGAPSEWSLQARPALGIAIDTASIDDDSRGRGIAEFKGFDLMLVNDDTWFRSAGSTVITGSGIDTESLAKFTLYSQAGSDRIVLVNAGDISEAGTNDGSVWFAADITSAPTQIVDADMPGNNGNSLCRGGVSLDGYFFVGDILGNINNSDLDNLTSWQSTGLVVAEREADTGIYIGKHRDHIIMLGTRSMEFYYNNANAAPASPLTRRQDLFYSIGCYHPNAIVELGSITYFIGKAQSGEAGLYKLEDMRLDLVGQNPILDKLISGLEFAEPDITGATDLQQNCYLSLWNSPVNGQFLVLTLPVNGTFAFHVATGTWSRWYLGGTPDNNGGITDWTSPRILPIVANLQRPGANTAEPNRYMLLNGQVVSEDISPGLGYPSEATVPTLSYICATCAFPNDRIARVLFNPSGSQLFIFVAGELQTNAIRIYNLTVNYDITTATFQQEVDFNALGDTVFDLGESDMSGGRFNATGTKFYYSSSSGFFDGAVVELDLSTPFDIATVAYNGKFLETGIITNGDQGMFMNPDGLHLYIATVFDDRVHSWTLSVKDDITSAVYDGIGKSLNCVGETGNPVSIDLSDDGKIAYVHEVSGTDSVLRYDLSVAYDLSSGTFTKTLISFSFFSTGALVRPSDERIWVANLGTETIDDYALTAKIPSELGFTTDYICYTKPWDMDTNERKRTNNIRLIHYPDPRAAIGVSNIGVDWIDTEDITAVGIAPAAFTSSRNIDINSMTARLYRAGLCRQRIYKLSFTGNRTQILKGLELDFDYLRG